MGEQWNMYSQFSNWSVFGYPFNDKRQKRIRDKMKFKFFGFFLFFILVLMCFEYQVDCFKWADQIEKIKELHIKARNDKTYIIRLKEDPAKYEAFKNKSRVLDFVNGSENIILIPLSHYISALDLCFIIVDAIQEEE